MTQPWRHYCKIALVGGLFSLVVGCSVFPKPTPQARYLLPSSPIQAQVQTQPGVLFVAVPQANRLLSGSQLLVQTEDDSLQAYKGALWADGLPTLLRERFINAFTDVQLFDSISGDASLHADKALETYIQRFQVQWVQGQPVVQVQISATLVDRATASILRSQRFESQQAAASTALSDVLEAFGHASDQISLDLIQWLQQP